MAETFARAIVPELSCPVCLELFVAPHIPKDLPDCDHICCEVCLKNLIKNGHCICPECRTNVVIPKGGISQFHTNLKIRNLAERYPKEMQKVPKSGQPEPICVEHDDAKMRYYCVPCNMLACQACIFFKHKGKAHISKKVEERFSEIQSQITHFQEVVDECNDTLTKLDKLKSTIKEKLEMQKEEVDVHVEDHIKEVRESGKQLKQQLEAATALILKGIDQQITDHRDHLKSVEKLKEDAVKSTESIPEADFILRHNAFPQKMDKLKKENKDIEMNESAVSIEYELPDEETPVCVGDIEQIIPAVQIKGNLMETK